MDTTQKQGLTSILNDTQLRQNIDTLMKAGKTRDEVLGYVDNYQ